MSVNDLSAVLWRERELLELLTFKLEEEQLLLAAGRSRWVSHASREVEQVLERLRSTGLERAASSAAVAEEWGVDPDAPLRDVVAAAPNGPWGEILATHLAAMVELTTHIGALRDENDRFLGRLPRPPRRPSPARSATRPRTTPRAAPAPVPTAHACSRGPCSTVVSTSDPSRPPTPA